MDMKTIAARWAEAPVRATDIARLCYELRVSTGATLSCAEQGDRNGIPLILLHGYSDSWRSFEPLMEQFPQSMRIIAITARGHGDSSKPTDGIYSVSNFAADAAAAMDTLSIAKAHIVGHSMGSLIGAALALDYPSRVESLVLIAAFSTLRGHRGVQEMWDAAIAPMGNAPDLAFVRGFQLCTLHRLVSETFLETIIGESLKVPGHVWRGALGAMMAEDRTAELRSIDTPVLLIGGDKDVFSDEGELARLKGAFRSPPGRLEVSPAVWLHSITRNVCGRAGWALLRSRHAP
jgi:pimeloyl-ACP methyl ester carboxylesterase